MLTSSILKVIWVLPRHRYVLPQEKSTTITNMHRLGIIDIRTKSLTLNADGWRINNLYGQYAWHNHLLGIDNHVVYIREMLVCLFARLVPESQWVICIIKYLNITEYMREIYYSRWCVIVEIFPVGVMNTLIFSSINVHSRSNCKWN